MKKPGSGKIFFRADGHAKMGLGHVIRSLALAGMLKDNFECHFIIRSPLPALKKQILEVCQQIIELPDTDDHIAEAKFITNEFFQQDDVVVLDGYHFQTTYQHVIKTKGCKLVCIDDIYACHYVADAIINHAGGITPANYSAEPYTRYYLGLEYALLRKPFLKTAKEHKYPDRNKSIFICMGGADPNNDTLEILKKCSRKLPGYQYFVVTGGAYQYRSALNEYLSVSALKAKVLDNLDANQMADYMKKCRVAITPPSTVAFEYLSLGGILFLKVIADNQININDYFLRGGLAFDFDTRFFELTEAEITNAEKKQKAVFDGKTPERFLNLFHEISRKDVSLSFS